MHAKKYRAIKLGIVIVLASTIGSFVQAGNFIVPLIAFALAAIAILLLSRNVSEIRNDERVEKIGGQAARYTLSILIVGAAIASIVLSALARDVAAYRILAYVTSGVVWFSLISYAGFFHLFNQRGE